MTALSETQARIGSIAKLRTVVGAMRGMAATHAQQARAALVSYRAYADVVARGLGRALALVEPGSTSPPRRQGPIARVVCSAEHGFAGAFAARLLDAANPAAEDRLFILGSRGVALAEQRRWRPDWTSPAASQTAAVPATARRVADALYGRLVADGFAGVEVVYARLAGASDYRVERRSLLPLDLGSLRTAENGPPPLTNLAPRRLVERLVGEYVFAELALAALESFASENAARLATMESARLNIDEKLEQLSAQERLQRQEEITAEVQDVVAGALAAGGTGARRC